MNRSVRTAVLAVVLAAAAILGAYYFLRTPAVASSTGLVKDSGDNVSDFSAVFLTNGQVYFGKINGISANEVNVSEIFYLQVNQKEGETKAGQQNQQPANNPDITLVKLGNELHGPNDRMRINRTQVLFTESLKSDSKVVKAIGDYKAK